MRHFMLLFGSRKPVPVQNAKRWIFCRYTDTWCNDSRGWFGTPAGSLSFISLKKTAGTRLSANTTPLSAMRRPMWLVGNLLNATNLHITENRSMHILEFPLCMIISQCCIHHNSYVLWDKIQMMKWWIRNWKGKAVAFLRHCPRFEVNTS